ncbi:MAG: hypothetical protein ISQ34_04710 [Rickettsiales bacterium]|nr:hypothetical protein [Rickettsiales bacterium]
MKKLFILFLSFALVSCSYKPIFAPNTKFETVGEEKADQDFENCNEKAEKYLAASKKRRAAKEGVRGAGIGAIFGAIFGLFTGDIARVAKSAAIGAGAGGVTKGGSVLAENKLKPDQIKQRYISRCLSHQGYEIIGWE